MFKHIKKFSFRLQKHNNTCTAYIKFIFIKNELVSVQFKVTSISSSILYIPPTSNFFADFH